MADYGITHRIAAGTNGPRSRTDYIVIHTQEGGAGDAVGLARYCANAGVSYNVACDDVHTVQMVAPGNGPWAAVAANSIGFHICGAGTYASWGRGRWLSKDAADGLNEDAMLWRIAKAAAAAAKDFNVPVTYTGNGGTYRDGNWPKGRGVCGHVDFGSRGGGHHDPGVGFPFDVLLDRMNHYLKPVPIPNLIEREAQVAKAWIGKRLAKPGAAGETPIIHGGRKLGAFVPYEHGHIYWRNGAPAAYAVPHGGLFEAYAARGWEKGVGFPLLRHQVHAWGGNQSFEGGVLFVPHGGDPKGYLVHGKIGQRYAEMGWETGPLGLPTSDEQPVPGTDNIVQYFEHGSLRWSPTGVIVDLNDKETK